MNEPQMTDVDAGSAAGASAESAARGFALTSALAERDSKFFAADTSGSAVVGHDSYDLEAYDQALSDFPNFKRTVKDKSASLSTAPALIRDLFWLFHKRQPTIAPPAPLKPAFEVNRQVVEQVMRTIEYRQVREAGTAGDLIMSSMATMAVAEKAIDALGAETLEKINHLSDLEAEMSKLFAQAEALEDLAAKARGKKANTLFERARLARESAEENRQQVEELTERVEAAVTEAKGGIRQAARQALETAEAAIDATNEAIKAYTGGYDQGSRGFGGNGRAGLSAKDKLNLANKVRSSEKLKQIAELCGRLTRIALAVQRAKVKHPPDEIASIETGNDIAHMLPSELALLADADLENLFLLKYVEKRLMQYELIHQEPQGRGPIIMAIDESGSMTEVIDDISKEVWAKGVALALLAIARLQQRDVAIIHFSSANQLKVQLFAKGEASAVEALQVAEFFYNGGTSFEPWMKKALELINDARFNRADCICVTDGLVSISSQVTAEWLRTKAAREMRAFGILIGTSQGAGTLASITDAMLPLEMLKNDMPVLEQIFAI